MATDVYWQVDKEEYNIVDQADFMLRVVEHEIVHRPSEENNNQATKVSVPSMVHLFKVDRATLATSSLVFKKMISPDGPFKESTLTCIDLLEDHPQSVEIWLKLVHGSLDLKSTYSTTTITGVWEVLETAHKYAWDPEMPAAKAWFSNWYGARNSGEFDFGTWQTLLFPTYTFDHAQGFAAATKYIAYHAVGHATEKKPPGFSHDHLHLPQRIIQQVNAAKGRLRTILHRGLYEPIESILRSTMCDEHPKSLFFYELALTHTGAWPIESKFLNNNVDTMLRKLANFRDPPKRDAGCLQCNDDFAGSVTEATRKTSDYFDGCCLDCMAQSKPKFEDEDSDYWKHSRQNVAWDEDCRLSHDQPTWYFSFMGRKEKQIQWTKQQRRN
ncbi:uncharacterized protein LTR77_010183 [Saxophila tyrrhenica]|uniref:BTB domain-containing protein n=1 Tax=Saxophila tyrrhenica TaxID=1690608 RepID=A0AAV9NW60_9PEZI|nr:hypothetical protein LTR77_010183 [Saxophila tyrrhenica]